MEPLLYFHVSYQLMAFDKDRKWIYVHPLFAVLANHFVFLLQLIIFTHGNASIGEAPIWGYVSLALSLLGIMSVGILFFFASKSSDSSPKLGLVLGAFALFSIIASGCLLLPITCSGNISTGTVKGTDSNEKKLLEKRDTSRTSTTVSTNLNFAGLIPPSTFMLLVSCGMNFLVLAVVTFLIFMRMRASGSFSNHRNVGNVAKQQTLKSPVPRDGDEDRPKSGPREALPPNTNGQHRDEGQTDVRDKDRPPSKGLSPHRDEKRDRSRSRSRQDREREHGKERGREREREKEKEKEGEGDRSRSRGKHPKSQSPRKSNPKSRGKRDDRDRDRYDKDRDRSRSRKERRDERDEERERSRKEREDRSRREREERSRKEREDQNRKEREERSRKEREERERERSRMDREERKRERSRKEREDRNRREREDMSRKGRERNRNRDREDRSRSRKDEDRSRSRQDRLKRHEDRTRSHGDRPRSRGDRPRSRHDRPRSRHE